MTRFLASLLLASTLGTSFATPVAAQSLGQVVSPVLVIDREILFTDTQFGERVRAELEAEQSALAEETRKIEAALEAEEKSLTEQRATLSVEEFRSLADAFDEKVVALRSDRDQAQSAFLARFEEAQRQFYARIGPILARLMQERGGVAILDKRQVLLSVSGIDVTEAAVARIDSVLGDGAPTTPAPTQDMAPSTAEPNGGGE